MNALTADNRCPIARSLVALGDKWTLLIVREALLGRTRFGEFHEALGIPRDVLTARLNLLVDGGVLEKRAYKPDGGRQREEYLPTEAGRALAPVLAALGEWGARYRRTDLPGLVDFVESRTGEPARVSFVAEGRVLAVDEVRVALADNRSS